MRKNTKIIAACQDPGGCNAIYPVLKKLLLNGENVALFASGYSVELLKRSNTPFSRVSRQSFSQINKLFKKEKPSIILVGTSMGHSLEDVFVEEGRRKNIPSLAILDSWINYSLRFTDLSSGEENRYLPDIVCVMDEIAQTEMIDEGIPPDRIRVTGNPYFDDIYVRNNTYLSETKKGFLEKQGLPSDTRVLSFFSQTIDKTFGSSNKDPSYLGYVQFDALELLIAAIREILKESNRSISLVVRPHPKEEKVVFEQFKKKTLDFPIVIDTTEESRDILAASEIITGMFSSILIEANILGKKIISIQPSLSTRDPFVLSRLGIIKTATTLSELRAQLETFLSNNQIIFQKLESRLIGKATDNILEIIYATVPTLRKRV